MENIIQKSWKGVEINEDENKNFLEIIGLVDGRRIWTQKLNEKRISDEFRIPSNTFGIICGLSSVLLDKVKESNDINCAKQIVFLSQHFYEETVNYKTFMHQVLLTHPLWEDYKLWSNLIISSVDLELESDAKLCAENKESINRNLKLRPVLCSKLANYLQQMRNFIIDAKNIEKVVRRIQEYYKFDIDVIAIEN